MYNLNTFIEGSFLLNTIYYRNTLLYVPNIRKLNVLDFFAPPSTIFGFSLASLFVADVGVE